ncbi:MAG: hypothetical protein H0T42_32615, partial [Deltaproteobacteria bacterium]|nr:hypothetical protein [Deltaproteobacteria bacterium]
YMSPEQCRGTGDVDHRADLYSIGCVFQELLTGKPPFVDLSAAELLGAHLFVDPPRPSESLPSISRDSEKLIMSLLAKDPAHRPQSAKELGQRFQEIAVQQGWITHASPAGVTALRSSMPLMTPPPGAVTKLERGISEQATIINDAPQASLSGATTPFGMTSPALMTPASMAEKPTTLSGAASQSVVDLPRRSRKGLGLAMAAAALIAGSTVAFFRLQGTGPRASAGTFQPAAARADASMSAVVERAEPAPSKAEPAPIKTEPEPIKTEPEPIKAEPEPIKAEPAPIKPQPEPAATAAKPGMRKRPKPDQVPALKPMPAANPDKPRPAKPEPNKPVSKKPLFETDL